MLNEHPALVSGKNFDRKKNNEWRIKMRILQYKISLRLTADPWSSNTLIFTSNRGEVFTIMGGNGCGKSTIMLA